MKLEAPAAERNKQPILEVLKNYLPSQGTVLDISSGSGIHVNYFAEHYKELVWQPSDPAPEARKSIEAYREESEQSNVLSPLDLDVLEHPWPLQTANFIVNINMLHISPPSTCKGLMKGAGQLLDRDEYLYIYGPFILKDRETAASNLRFIEWLKTRNPEFGLRNLEEVKAIASQYNLAFQTCIDMPANNYSVIFQKQ